VFVIGLRRVSVSNSIFLKYFSPSGKFSKVAIIFSVGGICRIAKGIKKMPDFFPNQLQALLTLMYTFNEVKFVYCKHRQRGIFCP
jgi:hypothetical protein